MENKDSADGNQPSATSQQQSHTQSGEQTKVQVTEQDLKGKEVDADPEKEEDQPVDNRK